MLCFVICEQASTVRKLNSKRRFNAPLTSDGGSIRAMIHYFRGIYWRAFFNEFIHCFLSINQQNEWSIERMNGLRCQKYFIDSNLFIRQSHLGTSRQHTKSLKSFTPAILSLICAQRPEPPSQVAPNKINFLFSSGARESDGASKGKMNEHWAHSTQRTR